MKMTLCAIKTMGGVMLLLSIPTSFCAEELLPIRDWSVRSVSEHPKLEITVRGYPDSIQFGDSIYLICTLKNVGEEVIEGIRMSYQFEHDNYRARTLECYLLVDGNMQNTYENLPEDRGARRSFSRRPGPAVSLLPDESRIIYVHTFEFPSLEDQRHPFWEKLVDKFETDGVVACTMRFTVGRRDPEIVGRVLNHNIDIRPRSKQEMDLLKLWLDKSDKKHLPVTWLMDRIPRFKVPFGREMFSAIDDNEIVVQREPYNPWLFFRLGNRKPPAHLCPTTWQGWKELEDNLAPSTMRDEIRLTRILVQYCDTHDIAVLDELKTWFLEMNEIQRWCMAKSILDRCQRSHDIGTANNALFESFRSLYHTIREHDLSTKPEYYMEYLKILKLIE